MKTLKQILDREIKNFNLVLTSGEEEYLKNVITQSIKDALEACRVDKKADNLHPELEEAGKNCECYRCKSRDGFNQNTTQYDENVRKFIGEEEI